MTEPTNFNPYSPPDTTDFAPPVVPERLLGGSVRGLVIGQMGIFAAAYAATFYEIRSIVISGVVFSCVGTVLAILSYRQAALWSGLLGLSAIGLAILLVTLINVFTWSPPDAEKPVRIIGAIYAAITIPWSIACLMRQDTVAKVTSS